MKYFLWKPCAQWCSAACFYVARKKKRTLVTWASLAFLVLHRHLFNEFASSAKATIQLELSLAVCVVVKDDEAYIDEWLDYHHALGFSHFYVYDSSLGCEMKQLGAERGDHVTVLPLSGQESKISAYADCTRRLHGKNYHWAAYLNVEEFLMIREHDSVKDLVQAYGRYDDVLSVPLLVFGSGGRRTYSPQPVTRRFLYREYYNENRERLILFRLGHETTLGQGRNTRRRKAKRVPPTVATIHHYLRSEKEYKHKMGKPIHYNDSLNNADKHEFNLTTGTIFDDSGWKSVLNLLPAYEIYDEKPSYPAPRYPSRKTNETAAVCVIVKYEEAYIDEWMDYHHALGFSHFYVYDNSPEFEMEQWASEKGDHVTIKHMTMDGLQSEAYLDCLKNFVVKDKHTWVAFFDVDEMIILKDHRNIVDMLHDYCPSGALSLNWLLFGAAGREVYQPLPFTKRFKYSEENVNFHVKSIAKVADIDLSLAPQPHHLFLLPTKFQRDVNGNHLLGPFNMNRPSNVSVIHHYTTKSFKEYVAKRMRGKSDTPIGKEDLIQHAKSRYMIEGTQFTEEGWKATKRFLPKYRDFDLIA